MILLSSWTITWPTYRSYFHLLSLTSLSLYSSPFTWVLEMTLKRIRGSLSSSYSHDVCFRSLDEVLTYDLVRIYHFTNSRPLDQSKITFPVPQLFIQSTLLPLLTLNYTLSLFLNFLPISRSLLTTSACAPTTVWERFLLSRRICLTIFHFPLLASLLIWSLLILDLIGPIWI